MHYKRKYPSWEPYIVCNVPAWIVDFLWPFLHYKFTTFVLEKLIYSTQNTNNNIKHRINHAKLPKNPASFFQFQKKKSILEDFYNYWSKLQYWKDVSFRNLIRDRNFVKKIFVKRKFFLEMMKIQIGCWIFANLQRF